jgi:hypothetical protein
LSTIVFLRFLLTVLFSFKISWKEIALGRWSSADF